MFQALQSLIAKYRTSPAGSASPSDDAALRSGAGRPHSERGLHVAACALLLEIAHADDAFTNDERKQIEEVLVRHFALDAAEAADLLVVAEEVRREAIDLHAFTSVINRHYDEGQRLVLAELLWRIVYADGRLSSHEDRLARKLAILLELPAGYLSEARNRALRGGAASGGDSSSGSSSAG